ncbi:MAG TPA: hypothetical protein PKY51_09990 [Fimbriimonadaceae bacterium]|jgi:hypothetical protein|nr:hypothetical protein [Fimbriimonadaceae bacterium]
MKTPTRLEALVNVAAGDAKKVWRRIGVAFPLKNKPGYSVKLELLPVPTDSAFEFILVEPSDPKSDPAKE